MNSHEPSSKTPDVRYKKFLRFFFFNIFELQISKPKENKICQIQKIVGVKNVRQNYPITYFMGRQHLLQPSTASRKQNHNCSKPAWFHLTRLKLTKNVITTCFQVSFVVYRQFDGNCSTYNNRRAAKCRIYVDLKLIQNHSINKHLRS